MSNKKLLIELDMDAVVEYYGETVHDVIDRMIEEKIEGALKPVLNKLWKERKEEYTAQLIKKMAEAVE